MKDDDLDITPLVGQTCTLCNTPLQGGQTLYNWILGYVDALYCLDCLVKKQDVSRIDLLETLHYYIDQRPCFQKAWDALEKSHVGKLKE